MNKELNEYDIKIVHAENCFTEQFPYYPIRIDEYYEPRNEELNYLHYHNDFEIGFCYSGSGVFYINEQLIHYQAPCICIIYPGQAHIAQSKIVPNKWKFININCDLLFKGKIEYLKWNLNNQIFVGPQLFTEQDDKEIFELVKILISELKNKREHYIECFQNIVALILTKHSRYNNTLPEDNKNSRYLNEILPAISYIAENYHKNIYINEIAELCFLSETSLRRYFNMVFNMSPNQYVHKVRIYNAIALMQQPNINLLDIGVRVGYNSQSSFNRQFSKIMGCCPTEYMKYGKEIRFETLGQLSS